MAAFEGLDFLAMLPTDQRARVLERVIDVDVAAGDEVIAEGAPPSGLWLVGEGVLRVESSRRAGETLVTVGPGSILGEASLATGRSASASVRAVERSVLLHLPSRAIDELSDDPDFATAFWKALAASLAHRLVQQTGSRRGHGNDSESELLPDAIIETLAQAAELLERCEGEDSPELDAALDQLILDLDVAIGEAVADDADGSVMAQIRSVAVPAMLESDFVRRVWEKPHGYAGDWITIEHVYEMTATSTTRRGRFIDGGVLRMPPPEALRNRRHLLAEQIVRAGADSPAEIMSLACGPAREVWDVFGSHPASIARAHLLDIDPTATSHVEGVAETLGLQDSVEVYRANLIKLALGSDTVAVPPLDLVYSIGLIDYFPDDMVIGLLDLVHEWLRPGGKVILGNFHPRNPGKNFMDLFEWQLIHRNEEDMHRLFAASAFAAPCAEILYEPQRINLFAIGVRTEGP